MHYLYYRPRFNLRAILFHGLTALAIVCTVFLLSWLHGLWATLPAIDDPQAFLAKESFVINDRNGGELFRFYNDEDRTFMSLEELPTHVPHAFIAIEDKRFYSRNCIDGRALGRAALANIHSPKSQGASTITQQFARTAFLTRDKTLERKVKEIFLACQLESALEKDEILELYLNWISFGHGIAGIHQASQRFFNKAPQDLTIAESSILAALPQRPTYFSPYGPHGRTQMSSALRQVLRAGETVTDISDEDVYPGLLGTTAKLSNTEVYIPGRADTVLKALYAQSYIGDAQYIEAQEDLKAMEFGSLGLSPKAPHFVITLKEEVEEYFAKHPEAQRPKGITVETTLDSNLQALGEEIVGKYSQQFAEQYHTHNAALLALDRRTNEVLAYVGSPNFFEQEFGGQIDMVRVPRQPGSSFKPIVYAALLEQGYTPDTVIYDTPLNPRLYKPYHSGYYGRMTIRTALARSRNTPAIRAFYLAGGEEVILDTAAKLGITTPRWLKREKERKRERFKFSWPLALGSAESSLFEMVQAFSVFAHRGQLLPITAISSIHGSDNSIVLEPANIREQRIAAATADGITSILQDASAREPDWQHNIQLSQPAALKTGTSVICLERTFFGACKHFVPNSTWTIGYNNNLIVGVWVGNVNNAPMHQDAISLTTAVPIWVDFISQATQT